ncbi:DNA topoisomerase III [Anoxybacterium hadale]|uniref:DNA topoisomerase III n=1 Tax=Anoxybacterium hadale TaxID=3408580 RepID=A0ACD1AGY5_9FIRM|nr:DNA topoisomerase III [Clostridiales bacterium]
MGKVLVLAEKPSVGRELARVLGCSNAKEGHIVGPKYIVTWSLGHLVTLADPEYYGDQYKKWSLDTLPMMPKKMDLVVIKETGKQFNVVRNLMKNPEITELIIATDAGREGELVARWIIQKAGFHKPIKRLWISSQTDKSIRDGFDHLKPAAEYDNLYHSAQSRAEADWLVGLNVTRALTCKYNAQLSAGRVQTPTLAMIVKREEEIKRFIPKDYFCIHSDLNGFKAQWSDKKSGQTRISEEDKAKSLVGKLSGKDGIITDIKKDAKREAPPLLYDLTELQRDANISFGFSAKQTLNLMQRLYEEHKVLTYPRTDSRYITSDIVPTLKDRLRAVSSGEFNAAASAIIKSGIKTSKRIVDDTKVTDHHAIIPTEEYVRFMDLSSDERKIYDLVVKRFLAVFSPDSEYMQTTVKIEIENEIFTAKGKIIQQIGWKSIYGASHGDLDESSDDLEVKSQSLPELKQGQKLRVLAIKLTTGKTKPPARYTEATLLSAMEHHNLGTPATRADIIEKMFTANSCERRGKDIFPMSKGVQLINLVPEELKSPELTEKWEKRLTSISKGQEKSAPFISEMKEFASLIVSRVIASEGNYRHDNMTRTRCPLCDKFLLEVNGKKGKMLVCQDRECGYKQSLSYVSNARCPQCHKKLNVIGEGDKRIYSCPCGFREKFDRFNQQLAENRNKMGKRELQEYMKKQEKSQPQESAFALAWAKLQEEKKH